MKPPTRTNSKLRTAQSHVDPSHTPRNPSPETRRPDRTCTTGARRARTPTLTPSAARGEAAAAQRLTQDHGDSHEGLRDGQHRNGGGPELDDADLVRERRQDEPPGREKEQAERRQEDDGIARRERGAPAALPAGCPAPSFCATRAAAAMPKPSADRKQMDSTLDERLVGGHHVVAQAADDRDEAEKPRVVEDALAAAPAATTRRTSRASSRRAAGARPVRVAARRRRARRESAAQARPASSVNVSTVLMPAPAAREPGTRACRG